MSRQSNPSIEALIDCIHSLNNENFNLNGNIVYSQESITKCLKKLEENKKAIQLHEEAIKAIQSLLP